MPTKDKPIWNTGLINNGKLEQVYELAIVRHGHWIDVNGDGSLWRCSVCGETQCCDSNYCGDCGAKMDEVREDG